SPADGGLSVAVYIPGETKSGAESAQRPIFKGFSRIVRLQAIARVGACGLRIHEDVADRTAVAKDLVRCCAEFVAQSCIQGEIAGEAPIILSIKAQRGEMPARIQNGHHGSRREG